MASIREVRKTLMPVLIGLVVLDLACVGYLFSPAGRSREARQRDFDALQVQLTAKRQEVLPTRGMDGKLKQASQRHHGVSTRSVSRHNIPPCRKSWARWRRQTGVHLAAVKYDDKDAPVEGLRKLNIEISLSGDYLQEVKFINALERDKMFFLIDGVRWASSRATCGCS